MTKERKKLDEDQVKFYTTEILKGLKYLHDQRLVHRELCPHHVFLSSNLMIPGRVKIGNLVSLDFADRTREQC